MSDYKMVDINDIDKFISIFVIVIKKAFHYLLGALKKYFIIAILVFAGIVTSNIYITNHHPKYYQATVSYTIHYFTYKVFGQMVDNLNMLAATQSYNSLAAALNIPVDQAKTIVSIEGKDAYGKPLSTNASLELGPLYFEVKSTDSKVFPSLENGLLNYLNNSSPTQNGLRASDIASAGSKVQYLERDISMIDSIISAYGAYLKNSKNIKDTSMGLSNIGYLFTYKDQLEEKKVEKERLLKAVEQPVRVLYSFSVPEHPVGPTDKPLIILLIEALFASAVIVVLVRMFVEVKYKADQ